MVKLQASLRKEFLLLLRDLPGLAILFIMPVLLILVVTLAQENALRMQGSSTPILVVDPAPSVFSSRLSRNLDSSGIFRTVHLLKGVPLTMQTANRELAAGNFTFGVVVHSPDSAITILIDPTLQPSYRESITNTLTFIIKGTQSRYAIEELLTCNAGPMKPVIGAMISKTLKNLPPVNEFFPAKDRSGIKPDPIQNNVPGFILFAMFFIVIPLSGSIISEKNEGGYQRLRTLPVSVLMILSGKILLYLLVCMLQFLLMLLVGCQVFPVFFDLPGLQIGHAWLALSLATLTASLAAIGFGTLVGALSSTHNQAALFGSVMVVLLGIVSGTFFPIHIMPPFIQQISICSPMRWGIDNYLEIFIREGTILHIIPRCILLISFFGFAITTSIAIFANRKL